MTEQIYVKPKKGIVVKDPFTRARMPAEGRWVPRTRFWLRRVQQGDVERTKPPKQGAAAEATPADEAKK